MVWDGTVLRVLDTGSCNEINAHAEGELVAVSYRKNGIGCVIWQTSFEELRALPVPTIVVDDILPLKRPLWLGFFAGGSLLDAWHTTESPQSLPGNCYLAVQQDGLIFTKARVPFAQYVAAEVAGQSIVEEVKKAKKRHALPCVTYWTGKDQNGAVPPEQPGVEMYRSVNESVSAFEIRGHAAVRRCGRCWIIAQCYTSNTDNTPDLMSIPPAVWNVARANTNVIGILVFSGNGRKTGLQDHPEVRSLWSRLATEMLPFGAPPVVKPQPPEPKPSEPTEPTVQVFEEETMKIFARLKKYIGVDPSHTEVYTDRDKGGAWEEIELVPKDKGFLARFNAANLQLSQQPDGSLQTRPVGSDGPYETFFATSQPDGSNFMYRFHDGVLVQPILQIEEVK